jgi:hypothetical protein
MTSVNLQIGNESFRGKKQSEMKAKDKFKIIDAQMRFMNMGIASKTFCKTRS